MKNAVGIVLFIAIAFGLSWLIVWPLWQDGGLKNPLFLPLSIAMMYTPTIAALIAGKLTAGGQPVPSLGIRVAKGTFGGLVAHSLLAIFGALLVCIGGLFVGQAFGVYHLDLVHFSGFKELIEAKLAGRPLPAAMPPLAVLVVIQLIAAVVFAPVNAIAAVGEEIGWRGFLLPRLMPLGALPAVVIGGVIWGLWHAPLILLGYNYGHIPAWQALGCMSAMCVVLGACLGWLRLRTGSVWPSAIGHGAINAGAGFFAVLGTAGETVDVTQASVLGWTGWIIPAVIGLLLFLLWPPKRA